MNEARSSGPLIDRDAAAALMEPLTDLVVRAGAAILAVNRARDEDRRQARRIAGDGSGSGRRPDHWRRSRAARSGDPGAVRGARSSGEAALRRQLLSDRSARRHQGICRRPRRVHGQSRAGDQRDAPIGHHRRAGARTDMARPGRPGRRTAGDRRGGSVRAEPIHTRPSRSAASPGSWPSAARTAMPGPKPLSRAGPARSGRCSARRSNSAGWRRAGPISILASRRPANGTSRPATRSSPRPAARSRMRRAPICSSAQGAAALSCRNSSPGAIPRRRAPILKPPATSGYWARSCSSSGQRALASRRKRSGSAAKASRCSSRPNR